MRTLVTGGAGFVGRNVAVEFRRGGHSVDVTVHRNHPALDGVSTRPLDIRDEGETADVVASVDPDVTVHAAAMADADACERHPDRARAINVRGTEHVASACERHGSTLVLVSSSFVFSGKADRYREHDERDPVNVYGRTKVEAEDAVLDADCPSLVVRTDQPYGWPEPWHPPSMVSWVLDRLNDDGSVPVFDDWWNCPIHVSDLAESIHTLVREGRTGTFHVVGPEFVDRYEWARRIASAFGRDPERIERDSAADSDIPAERPNARLSIEKLQETIGLSPAGIEDGLARMADEWRNRDLR